MRQTNLVYLYKPKERKVLLAMKKRKFGEGKWNGVGGKVENGETVKMSAIRETKEEIGVDIIEENMKEAANINFLYESNLEWNQETKVFLVEDWQGEPIETEEMRPEWFDLNQIPYGEMWVSDVEWLPRILNGEILKVDILFNNTGDKVLDMKIEKW